MADTTDTSTSNTPIDNSVMHHIIDCGTGQVTIVDNSEEHATIMEEVAKQNAEMQAEVTAKAEARTALLAKLGITEEEAKLLLN
jgi:hypothetical protein